MAKRTKILSELTIFIDRKAPNTMFLDQESMDEDADYAAAEERAFAEFEADRDEGFLWITLSEQLGWGREAIVSAIDEVSRNPSWRPRVICGRAASFTPFLAAA
jgi:hypothetical protein